MTREEFKNKLKIYGGIRYTHDEEDNIVVIENDDLDLDNLKEISPDIIFRNKGCVNLAGIKEIPENIRFENDGMLFFSR